MIDLFGIEAGSQVARGRVEDAYRHVRGVVPDGHPVEVDDPEDRLVGVLQRDPLPDGPEVVADVEPAARLYPAEEVLSHGRSRPREADVSRAAEPTPRNARSLRIC